VGPFSTICNCAGWLVLTFSFASICTAVPGAVNACSSTPLFWEGMFSQFFTSLVMSTPTH
jgi:hypothetical protein